MCSCVCVSMQLPHFDGHFHFHFKRSSHFTVFPPCCRCSFTNHINKPKMLRKHLFTLISQTTLPDVRITPFSRHEPRRCAGTTTERRALCRGHLPGVCITLCLVNLSSGLLPPLGSGGGRTWGEGSSEGDPRQQPILPATRPAGPHALHQTASHNKPASPRAGGALCD